MTRINTNLSSLTAQQTLANSNASLQTTLTRLSTGLRINSGKDDPAGLIASDALGNEISSTQQAIANSQTANQMISTADSALGQIGSLLTSIRGLVTQAANSSAMSSDQIAANQLQINSSLDAINRISSTTTFQGQQLLNGNLGFLVAGGNNYSSDVKNLSISQANFGSASSMPISINVASAATQGTITDSVANGTVAKSTVNFQGGGSLVIDSPSGGTTYNGTKISFVKSSSVANTAPTAAYDATSNTLTVNVASTGTTKVSDIANAIATGTNFTIDSTSTISGNYDPTADANITNMATVSTTDGGSLTINGASGTYAGTNVVFATSATADPANPTAAYANGTLTVTVNQTATTSLANIAKAVNGLTGEFTASVNNAGNFDPTADAGPAKSTNTYSNADLSFDDATGKTTLDLQVVAKAPGSAAAPTVIVKSGAAEAVDYNTTSNTLTVTLDKTNGGTGGKYTAAQVGTVLSTVGNWTANGTGTAGDGAGQAAFQTFNQKYQVGNLTVTDDTTHSDAASTLFDSSKLPATAQAGNTSTNVAGSTTATLNALNTSTSDPFSGGAVGSGVGLTGALTVQIGGANGTQTFNFAKGATVDQIKSAINAVSDALGVVATADASGNLTINSQGYGSNAAVNVNVVSDAGNFGSGLSATHKAGTDISATVNGVAATGSGNVVSLNTPNLAFSATLADGVTAGTNVQFSINGGGALFQLGPDVTSAEQARLGIQSADTTSLGGAAGRLYELGSGQDASLAKNAALAGQIVDQASTQIADLRGQLGAFQQATIGSNINTLTNSVTNLTAAQSSIQDTDFAAESANLTREQILVQAGTTVLSVANKSPQAVLTLLQNA